METGINRETGSRLTAEPRSRAPRITPNPVRLPPSRYWVAHTRRAAREVPAWMIRGYLHANASDLAAAVAFNALIALVPTLLLLAAVVGFILHNEQILDRAVNAVLWSRPPVATADALRAIVDVRRNSSWFGLISLLGFAWVGTNFVSCIARSMNRVYGVPNRRFVHERTRDFGVIVGFAALLLLAALGLTIPTLLVNRRLDIYFEAWTILSWPVQAASYGVGFLAAIALFLLLYRVVPNAGQRLRDVWPGTVTAAVLFVLLSQVFPLYLRYFNLVSRYGKVLGFGLVLIVWFYSLAHVLLFGTYVNATYHWRHHKRVRYVIHRVQEPTEEGICREPVDVRTARHPGTAAPSNDYSSDSRRSQPGRR